MPHQYTILLTAPTEEEYHDVIIVEGPDGSGKSTLITRLSQTLRLPVADRVVGTDTKALLNIREWTEQNVSKGFQPVIFDRHRLISEPIYGPAIRDRQSPEFYDLTWLSDVMWHFYNAKPVIIYCMPDILTVRENLLADSETPEIVKNHIVAIYAGYVARASMDFTRGVGRLYNYKTTRFDDIAGWVNHQIEGRVSDDHRIRLPIPRSEGVHPRSDDGGRRQAGRRTSH